MYAIVVGVKITGDVLVDVLTDGLGVTTLVGLLSCGEEDALVCIDETIVVGTDMLGDTVVLREGEL